MHSRAQGASSIATPYLSIVNGQESFECKKISPEDYLMKARPLRYYRFMAPKIIHLIIP